MRLWHTPRAPYMTDCWPTAATDTNSALRVARACRKHRRVVHVFITPADCSWQVLPGFCAALAINNKSSSAENNISMLSWSVELSVNVCSPIKKNSMSWVRTTNFHWISNNDRVRRPSHSHPRGVITSGVYVQTYLYVSHYCIHIESKTHHIT